MGSITFRGNPATEVRFDGPIINKQSFTLRLPLALGSGAILASVGGLILWSWFATLTSAVIVPGVVVVESGRKYVQHLDGGVLKSLNVQEGQEVVAKQILMSLDPEVLDITSSSFERLLAMNIGTQIRLLAEQQEVKSLIFPKEMRGIDETVWLDIQQEEAQLFNSRQAARTSRIETLRSDGDGAIAAAHSVREQIKSQATRISLTEQELRIADSLARAGYGTHQRVLEINRSIAELESELSGLRSREIDIRQTSEHDRLETLQQKASFLETVAVDFEQAKKEHTELLLKLNTINQQKSALEIRAPVSGKVVNLTVHNIGGVIGAGVTLLEIVPPTNVLVVEAEVRPDDIGDVSVGLPVDVRLAGIEGQQLPRLIGVVTRVSADRIEDLRREKSFFRVRAEIKNAALVQLGLHLIKPGMPVTLMIREGEQSPVRYLTSPLVGFFSRALK